MQSAPHVFYPGAGIQRVVSTSISLIEKYKPDRVLYMAGINNLTELKHNPRRICLCYENHETLVALVMDRLRDSRALLQARFPNLLITFGGIIGADIAVFNGLPGLSKQQDMLNQVILDINARIHDDNIAAGVMHPYMTSKVHKWTRGHCRYRYSLLEDGLHPGDTDLQNWAHIIESLLLKSFVDNTNAMVTNYGPVKKR